MSEEFGLEDTIQKRIGFLGADNYREPVVLQISRADIFDSSKGNRSLCRNGELVVDDRLNDDVNVARSLNS